MEKRFKKIIFFLLLIAMSVCWHIYEAKKLDSKLENIFLEQCQKCKITSFMIGEGDSENLYAYIEYLDANNKKRKTEVLYQKKKGKDWIITYSTNVE